MIKLFTDFSIFSFSGLKSVTQLTDLITLVPQLLFQLVLHCLSVLLKLVFHHLNLTGKVFFEGVNFLLVFYQILA